MMAALPVRSYDLEKSQVFSDWTYSVYPSLQAAFAGHTSTINMFQRGKTEQESAPASTFYDQILQTGQKKKGITQIDYLELFVNTLSVVTHYAPVYYSWVSAMVGAFRILHEDRERMRKELPNSHHNRWATKWTFKIPPYDSKIGRFRGTDEFAPLFWNSDGNLVEEDELN